MGPIPIPKAPWNEVIPGLWQGGILQYADGFPHRGAVMTLCTNAPNAPIYMREEILSFNDGDEVPGIVNIAVEKVLEWRKAGIPVLVRCQAGLNRSGLVVALTMVAEGWQPVDAIVHIRRHRSPFALCNKVFERHVRNSGHH